jgi:hypothetical protein
MTRMLTPQVCQRWGCQHTFIDVKLLKTFSIVMWQMTLSEVYSRDSFARLAVGH